MGGRREGQGGGEGDGVNPATHAGRASPAHSVPGHFSGSGSFWKHWGRAEQAPPQLRVSKRPAAPQGGRRGPSPEIEPVPRRLRCPGPQPSPAAEFSARGLKHEPPVPTSLSIVSNLLVAMP